MKKDLKIIEEKPKRVSRLRMERQKAREKVINELANILGGLRSEFHRMAEEQGFTTREVNINLECWHVMNRVNNILNVVEARHRWQ